MRLIRVVSGGLGIYDKLKGVVPSTEWNSVINQDELNWLKRPDINGESGPLRSYFTIKGYELFKARALPLISQYIDPSTIQAVESIVIREPVYVDEHQMVFAALLTPEEAE